MTHKRLTLFAGHYGSGKTNIALNYARWLRRKGEAVTVADLDIVNPYFRTKDSEEELKKEGLTTETVNASQKFVKAHPSTQIYEKYSRQYTAIIHSLIEYLPPKEKEKVDRLAALRDE